MVDRALQVSKDLCTGCALCTHICLQDAIHMEDDEEGFAFPVIDRNRCIKCNKCSTVCPINDKRGELSVISEQEVYACQATSKELLLEATAGGLFPLAAKWVLEQGGVVFGAAYNKRMQVIHCAAYDMDELKRFNGSKYVQSHIELVLNEVKANIEAGKVVLFSGTPCQIDAVKRYCRDISAQNLYTIDVVCYGVPSPKLFRDYLDTIEEKHKKKVTDFRFRDKHKNGWSHTTVITMQDKNGKVDSLEEEDYRKVPYYNMFGHRDCYRRSCYQCRYNTLQRVSDITTGNFWGIEKISRAFDISLGVSMAILNTEQGRELFRSIQHEMICERRSIAEAIAANDALIKGSKMNRRRDAVYRYYTEHGFERMYHKFYLYDWRRYIRQKMSKTKQKIKKMLRVGGYSVTIKQYMLLRFDGRRSIYASCTN